MRKGNGTGEGGRLTFVNGSREPRSYRIFYHVANEMTTNSIFLLASSFANR